VLILRPFFSKFLLIFIMLIDNIFSRCIVVDLSAGWSSLVARRAHNPKVTGSNPVPATKTIQGLTA
jgi:hypothetical protein